MIPERARPTDPDIDLFDSSSVEMWCEALHVNVATLEQAVQTVGTSGTDVAEYVRSQRLAKRN